MFHGIFFFVLICVSSAVYARNDEEDFAAGGIENFTSSERLLLLPSTRRPPVSRPRRETAYIVDEDFELSSRELKRNSNDEEHATAASTSDDVEGSGLSTKHFRTTFLKNKTPAHHLKAAAAGEQIASNSGIEGSGDEFGQTTTETVLPEQSSSNAESTATETVTEGQAIVTTQTGTTLVPIHPRCWNSSCDLEDVAVQTDQLVAEGSNITLFCSANTSVSDRATFRWYKSNEVAGYSLLENSFKKYYVILQTSQDDSGSYTCVKTVGDSCCHKLLHIKVYRVPDYKFQLIVVIAVTAGAFLICAALGICQNCRTKKYKKQMKKYKDDTEASFNLKG